MRGGGPYEDVTRWWWEARVKGRADGLTGGHATRLLLGYHDDGSEPDCSGDDAW